MNKITELIDDGVITLDDIEQYLLTIGKEVIDTNYLDMLEETLQNHPG